MPLRRFDALARVLVVVGFAFLPSAAVAQSLFQWTGANGSFSTTNNWSTGVPPLQATNPPTSVDSVLFGSPFGAYQVAIDANFTIEDLTSTSTDVTLSIQDGNSLVATGTVSVLSNLTIMTNSAGRLDNGGGLTRIASGGRLKIHTNARYDAGTLEVGLNGTVGTLLVGDDLTTSPGILNTAEAVLGIGNTSTGLATVSGTGSLWTNEGTLIVGSSSITQGPGPSLLTVRDGGILNTGALIVAQFAGSTGEVRVQDGGRIEGFTSFDAGLAGSAFVNVTGGGAISGGSMWIGVNGGTSSVVIDGTSGGGSPSTMNVTELIVGSATAGSLTVKNGAALTSSGAVLGLQSAGSGTIILNNSQWISSTAIVVGGTGIGHLQVVNSGTLLGTTLTVAAQPGSSGTVLVDGNVQLTGGLHVAVGPGNLFPVNSKSGSVTVASGLLSVQGVAVVGGRDDEQLGTVRVEGTGDWTVGGLLTIESNGDVEIVQQGTLTTGDSLMGQRFFSEPVLASVASVRVSGTDARWNSNGLLVVGSRADATVTLEFGAELVSNNVELADHYSDVDNLLVDASVTLQDGARWTNSGLLVVGGGGAGTIGVFSGTLATSAVTLGSTITDIVNRSSGTVLISGTSSVWNNQGLLQVGTLGHGVVAVSSGGTMNVQGELRIADGPGGDGRVEVQGLGSSLDVFGQLIVGAQSEGLLRVGNGASLDTHAGATIGQSGPLPGGLVQLQTGGQWTNTGSLTVGNQTAGALEIDGGAMQQRGAIVLGAGASAAGELTISNGSLTQTVGGVILGDAGMASLSILSGTVSFGGATGGIGVRLAAQAGSLAEVSVQGTGALWSVTGGDLIVGDLGEASLEISDGAELQALGMTVARRHAAVVELESTANFSSIATSSLEIASLGAADSALATFYRNPNNLVHVFGDPDEEEDDPPNHTTGSFGVVVASNADWENSGNLVVGREGLALLGLLDDAEMQSGDAVLAREVGSFAHVLVDQSTWAVNGSLDVGGSEGDAGGEGILTIINGGLVTVAGGTLTVLGQGTVSINSGAVQADATKLLGGGSIVLGAGGTLTTGSLEGNLTFTGKLAVGGGNASSNLAGVLSGLGSLSKVGTGTTVLTGSNAFAGGTTVAAGVLRAAHNNALGTGGVLIQIGGRLDVSSGITLANPITFSGGGMLSGAGTVASNVTIADGAILAPGNSPGTTDFDLMLEWGPGGNYLWEINDVDGGAGVTWDLVDIAEQLLITSTIGNKFEIDATSLTLGDVPGPVHDFDSGTSYAWMIATADGGVTGFDADRFTINTTSFSNSFNGTFSVSQSGNSLYVNYTAVPEPGSLFLAGVAAAGWYARSRRRKPKSTT